VRRVLETSLRNVYELVTVELAASPGGPTVQTVTGTPEHPFHVNGKGWVALANLGIGTQIVTRAGPALYVKSVTHTSHTEGAAVYNLTVEDDHSYFVGDANGGARVHNLNCQLHHIATDKNPTFTPFFKSLFKKFGSDLQDDANLVSILHGGIHPPQYHKWVLDNISRAGSRKEFLKILGKIKDKLISDPNMVRWRYCGPLPPIR
jgi:hypothetical protein